jgi:serine/threonine-protein kinase HipA
LLRKTQSEGTSYLELAQFIRAQGDAEYADADLEQLFRRVAFNIAVGDRDDHLRNHGFVLGKTGWKLAPAFDVNPNIDKTEQVLNIGDVDNRPSLETILSTAAFYALDDVQARKIMNEVVMIVDQWQDAARWIRTSGANIDLTAGEKAAEGRATFGQEQKFSRCN